MELTVKKNKKNGQHYITIPSRAGFNEGDKVIIEKLTDGFDLAL